MASKRRIRRKQCTGKARHADAGAALVAIAKLRRDKGFDGWMNAYRCKFCNGFHIGHAPRRHA